MYDIATADAQGESWWDALSDSERKQYVEQHPRSKYARDWRHGDEGGGEGKPEPRKPSPQARRSEQVAPTGPHEQRGTHQLVAAPDRSKWPEHIRQLKLPPAWTDVKVNPDPDGDLMAIGKDAKGRSQYVYSAKFATSQAALKYARIKELNHKFDEVHEQNQRSCASKEPAVKDHGECCALVMGMGIRPGSDDDTGAEKKAYGASTLEGRHVVVGDDGSVSLKFVGKKAVLIDLPVDDPKLSDMLRARAKAAGPDGKLFPHVTNSSLLTYVHSLDGGGFKTKDMRTLHGTRTAVQAVASTPAPKSEREYRRAVRSVAVQVARRLGNTWNVALSAYISPTVFAQWRADLKMGNENDGKQSASKEESALPRYDWDLNPMYTGRNGDLGPNRELKYEVYENTPRGRRRVDQSATRGGAEASANRFMLIKQAARVDESNAKEVGMTEETADSSWFQSLSPERKAEYKKDHPMSRLAGHVASLGSGVQRKFGELSTGARSGLARWHAKPLQKKIADAREGAAHAAKQTVHHAVNHLKHEVHTYRGAGAAVAHMASGKGWGSMHPHHKKALRSAIIHAGITAGSMAMGDLSGGAVHHSIGHLIGAFAADHVHHAAVLGAGEVGLKSGRDFVRKATAAKGDAREVEAQAARLASMITRADIPPAEWIRIQHAIEQALDAKRRRDAK